jgi:hypothetical protein
MDNLIGIAPDLVADSHFQITMNLLYSLGFVRISKTVAPSYVATCLGIVFNICSGVLKILKSKLEETSYIFFKFITKINCRSLSAI